ncbi:MAG: molybdate ABC transporter substrate-binding protein [Deltaproteobacteria bacterium]|nr:molybdate ABC transporter substrate-binding protein [Deltaproteobacteria bacterium]
MRNIFLLIVIILITPRTIQAADIYLSVAASLREMMADAAQRFEAIHPEHRVVINSSSSGVLARQIKAGLPVDIFVSANPQWMTFLVEHKKVSAEQVINWATNQMVLVGRGDKQIRLHEIGGLGRVALGSPDSVPAGGYAKALLSRANLYADLERQRQLVFSKDVRQALLYAEQGVVDVAIVYASDVRLLQEAAVLLTPDPALQPDIRYQMALTADGERSMPAHRLLGLLTSTSGAELLATYGLTPLQLTKVN